MNGDASRSARTGPRDLAGRVTALEDRFREARPLRAGSLIVTLFGDAIVPRGGSIWLGSLARLLAPLGISDRLVRTSVFRLVRDGWLQSEQVGRRSYYRPTPDGRRRFERAALQIYSTPVASLSGDWSLVIVPSSDTAVRDRVRKALTWLGYGRLGANVLAHPDADSAALADALADAGATDVVVTMTAAPSGDVTGEALAALAASAWDLEDLQSRYATFARRFEPLLEATTQGAGLDPAPCLSVRLLMIHDYRKIVLRDPRLPNEALPGGWIGHRVYRMVRTLYGLVTPGAEQHLTQTVETVDGPLPRADTTLRARFADDLA